MPPTPSAESDARRARILQLRHVERWSFRMIADELGVAVSYVHGEYRKACREFIPLEEINAARQRALDRYDQLDQELLRVVRTPHYAVQFGKLAKDDNGNLLIDDGPAVAAVAQLRQNEKRVADIYGYDAPSRQTLTVVTEDLVDAEIKRLSDEMELLPEDVSVIPEA